MEIHTESSICIHDAKCNQCIGHSHIVAIAHYIGHRKSSIGCGFVADSSYGDDRHNRMLAACIDLLSNRAGNSIQNHE